MQELDKKKVSKREFIKRELTENPEFFKAYPHLQGIFALDEEKDKIREDAPYRHDLSLNFKEANE